MTIIFKTRKHGVGGYNWKPSSLSKLTPIISDMELTYLGSEAYINLDFQLILTNNFYVKSVPDLKFWDKNDQIT